MKGLGVSMTPDEEKTALGLFPKVSYSLYTSIWLIPFLGCWTCTLFAWHHIAADQIWPDCQVFSPRWKWQDTSWPSCSDLLEFWFCMFESASSLQRCNPNSYAERRACTWRLRTDMITVEAYRAFGTSTWGMWLADTSMRCNICLMPLRIAFQWSHTLILTGWGSNDISSHPNAWTTWTFNVNHLPCCRGAQRHPHCSKSGSFGDRKVLCTDRW